MLKMSRRKKIQMFSISLSLISVLILLCTSNWNEKTSIIGFCILAIGTLGSILSIFIPNDYTFNFTKSDWQKNEIENDYFLIIEEKKHGIGNSPLVQTFRDNNNTFEEVSISSHQDEVGNITISANSKFKGKVIIT